MNGRLGYILRTWVTKRGDGQSLTEMTLVLPILILLLMGLVEFGLILYAHVQVANATREAARAASLYRSTRYSTMSNPTGSVRCDNGTDVIGWTLLQTAREAIVAHGLNNQGCPSGAIVSTSLGWLDPQPTPDTWTVTVDPPQSTFVNTNASNRMPVPGAQATVTLNYPYHLVIVSNLLPSLTDPIWITKSVDFEYHQ